MGFDLYNKLWVTSTNQLPNMFQNPESRSSWKLRCKWWARRHFSRERIYLEQQENGKILHTFF